MEWLSGFPGGEERVLWAGEEIGMPVKYVKTYTNAECLDCKKIEKDMIRVGAFILCYDCAIALFPMGAYDTNSEIYKRRLKIYSEQK